MNSYIFIVYNQEQISSEKQISSSKEHHENKKVNKKYPVAVNTIDENGKQYFK